MTTYQNAKELSQLSLGKATKYVENYSPTLLQAVPRSLNRNDLALNTETLPFVGEDVWYGYELSWLNPQGKPIVALAEFRFPCTSPNLVESKSFKLYLNSFNQSKFASWQAVLEVLTKDLSQCAGTTTEVKLFPLDNCPPLAIASINALCIDHIEVSIENYDYQPELLAEKIASPEIKEEHLVSHLLKSNCLITSQPDWASLYIHYQGEAINHAALLKYIISFRKHNEFHEQCVERIFCDLQKYYQLEELTVFARYTRRGGLDINPFRSTHLNTAPHLRTIRQ